MRISSASATCLDALSEPADEFAALPRDAAGRLHRWWRGIDRHLSAIAHAEAGNLDAAKEILMRGRPVGSGRPGHIVWSAGQE